MLEVIVASQPSFISSKEIHIYDHSAHLKLGSVDSPGGKASFAVVASCQTKSDKQESSAPSHLAEA